VDKLNKTLVDNWVRIDLNRGREKKGKEAEGAFHAYLTTSYNILL
jgi:hypothetical protein